MIRRFLLTALLLGPLGAGVPSPAQAAEPCVPEKSGERLQSSLPPEFPSCVEAPSRPAVNPGQVVVSLPAVHWYNDVIQNGKETETRLPPGKVVTVNFWGTTELKTIKGTLSRDVSCRKLDADATVENPVGEGTGTQTITSFSATDCAQSRYCRDGEAVEVTLKNLPLTIDTFRKSNGYRFSHWHDGFVVLCNGVDRANVGGGELLPYWSNGRYEVSHPPNLDFDDGGHYGQQYGNAGNLELAGSRGAEIIQPKAYWYYLGYKRFQNAVIPTRSP
jgi:hypothetical protein